MLSFQRSIQSDGVKLGSSKLENVWKIMKEISLQFDGEIDSELVCTICKKVMVKACNGPCGCRYCWDCIVDYLDSKEKICPTGLKECYGEIINVNENIQIDQPINTKISKLIVKCPQTSCENKCELRMIEDHIEKCKECLIPCPYFEMGCCEDKLVLDKIKDHLTVQDYYHTKLMIDSVNNLKNEISLLKNNIVNLTKHTDMKIASHLKSEPIQTDVQIMKTKTEIDMSISKLDGNLNTMATVLKNQAGEIEKDIHSLQMKTNQTIIDLKAENKKNKMEFEKLNESISSVQNCHELLLSQLESVKLNAKEQSTVKENEMSKILQKYCTLTDENKLIKKEIEALKNGSRTGPTWIEGFQEAVQKLNDSNMSLLETTSTVSTEMTTEEEEETSSELEDMSDDDSIGSEQIKHVSKLRLLEKKIKMLELNQNLSNEFIWVIENLSVKRRSKSEENKIIYSEPFFSHQNGYKMRLHLYPNGKDGSGKILSVCFSIMRGIYDDILGWPFQHDVIISLINQETGQNHKTKTAQYKNSPKNPGWKKPVSEVNREKCFWNFISWNAVENNVQLFNRGRIFIKCSVKLNYREL